MVYIKEEEIQEAKPEPKPEEKVAVDKKMTQISYLIELLDKSKKEIADLKDNQNEDKLRAQITYLIGLLQQNKEKA